MKTHIIGNKTNAIAIVNVESKDTFIEVQEALRALRKVGRTQIILNLSALDASDWENYEEEQRAINLNSISKLSADKIILPVLPPKLTDAFGQTPVFVNKFVVKDQEKTAPLDHHPNSFVPVKKQ